ncbi:hypothetical protein I302_103650 [Kwoniella bestiolae CBS 10118]|uniref:Protein SMG7 n=1 Tax=Kwoniella bestiolae CBS 10118 TaxID=1296100 RepID=A0AAJ8K6D8_9TREE
MSRRQSQTVSRSGGERRSAADLDRDARSEAGNLNGILSSLPPWSREAEQVRQRCRDTHLLLIFSHPLSPYYQSLDNLWHQTSYLIISAYRNIISNIERSSSSPSSQGRRDGRRTDNNANANAQGNELRKVITRFKQFLASEESFYKSLISRIYNYYDLFKITSISRALVQVKIPLGNDYDDNEDGGQENRDKIGLIYKGLICLGDLERYKEQYYGQQQNQKSNRRGTGGAEERFGEARKYYEVARSVQPDDGAAFNQLAVISTYTSDSFSTTYYYFRASAIRNAFKGIDGILYEYLGKATERWRGRRKEEKEREESAVEAGNEVRKWKEEMIVLVGILYLKAGFSFIPTLQPILLDQFGSLLRSRQLSTENIVKTVIIVIGLHHHARNTAGIEQDPKLIQRSHEGEFRSLELLLGISEVIMKIACEEIEEVKSTLINESALATDNHEDEGEGDDLTVYISAILRRILPSLRIVSKWIKLDLEYLFRQKESHPTSTIIKDFWITYKKLIDELLGVFPISQLPSLPEPLEEDLDMKGFLPLQRGITTEGGSNESNDLEGQGEVHPNEEQLMRLADIQVDAKLIMQSAVGSALLGNELSLPLKINSREQESDIASVSTETEDDPVNLAMRATLASKSSIDGDEEKEVEADEEIIWNKSPPPGFPPPAASMPVPPPSAKKPTAYDLLQNLMLENTPTPPAHTAHLPPTTSSPSLGIPHSPHAVPSTTPGNGGLLFGSSGNVLGQGGSSIWAMTREESEKGQKRSSTGMGQANIAAIWGNPTAVENNVHGTPPTASAYYGQHSHHPQQVSQAPANVPQASAAQQQFYTHSQAQYPYQPQSNQHPPPINTQQHVPAGSNTWGTSNIPLPLPLPLPQQQPISSAYPYDQTPNQNSNVPYYLQPAYYNAKPYGNWGQGTGTGAGTGTGP